MKKTAMLNETYEGFRAEIIEILKELGALISRINNEKLSAIIDDLRTNVTDPFLFVVVGEIKSGKSSFINALLGETVCKVDPAPCTDVIQELVYAPEKTTTEINPNLRRIGLPIEILKDIAIVDTPGTNTIIEHHHEITERFIPNSGLVLFVFPAKNPHTKSAWELLDIVNVEWRKRVVFVLQQADIASENELRVNREKVAEYAEERGIADPMIFVVSAKLEQQDDPQSGFDRIRDFIRQTVTGGRHFFLKLQTVIVSAEQVLKRVYDALKLLEQQLEMDRRSADEIEKLLEETAGTIHKDIRFLVDRLLEQYDLAAADIRAEFENGLSVYNLFKRGIGSTMGRSKSVKKWVKDLQQIFENRMSDAFEDVIGEGTAFFVRTFHGLTDGIVRALGSGDAARYNRAGEFVDIGAKRQETIEEIRTRIRELAGKDFVADTIASDPGSMPTQLVGGSALTLLGVILYASHIAFLDVTGGVIAGVGVLMAGGVLVIKKGRILKEFDESMKQARGRFETSLTRKLTTKFDLVLESIRRSVEPFFEDVTARQKKISPLMGQGEAIQQRLAAVSERLEATATKQPE